MWGRSDGTSATRTLDFLTSEGRRGSLIRASVVFAVFVFINAALYAAHGIVQAGDTVRYLNGANHLLNGSGFQEKESSYLAYCALVALAKRLGGGLNAVVVVQIVVAACAAGALYSLGKELHGRGAGLAAALLFVANPDIQRWNLYVLTDSLYISLVVLAVFSINRCVNRGGLWWAICVITLTFAALERPNGWVLLPIALIYWTATSNRPKRLRLGISLAIAASFVGLAAVVPVFSSGIAKENPTLMMERGQVIWGHDEDRLKMPAAGPEVESPHWTDGLGYALRHVPEVARLAIARVTTEVGHTRSFYSRVHNLFIVIWLLPLYTCAVMGFPSLRRKPLASLILAVLFCHLGIVSVTFADWDGRFLLYVLPLIGVLAASGVATVRDPLLTTV
jgi:4-amino-4-deoxy-L-arabinose transferase-like glycosyltransferase